MLLKFKEQAMGKLINVFCGIFILLLTSPGLSLAGDKNHV